MNLAHLCTVSCRITNSEMQEKLPYQVIINFLRLWKNLPCRTLSYFLDH